MAGMVMGSKGGGGATEQTLEESRKWAKLRRYAEGQGGKVDIACKVVGVKHPHEIKKTINGKTVLMNWGEETPAEDRTKLNDDGKTVKMQPGCLLTYEAVQQGIEGLRFYKDGTYSGNEKTALFKTGAAIFGKAIVGQQIDPDVDYLEKHLILTIEQGNDHDRKTADGSPAKAGCYWNVRDYRPVPKAAASLTDDDEDDDFPTPAAAVTAAPATTIAARSNGTATVAPLSSRSASTAVATLDDDDDIIPPF